MTTTEPDLYYDPYDFDIDVDPYPLWARMREERPLYYNERYDFFALSRFEDVERAFKDWGTYSSARGTLIELITADYDIPPGSIIFEDPPGHDVHRSVLRSEEHTSELQSLMRISSAVFCLQQKTNKTKY